jgi:Bacterial protein of unknown function (DUF924)
MVEDPEVDREISERFGGVIEQARGGELDHWANTARGRPALIVVLDQFSRNAYRGTPQAYAQDPKALRLALEGIEAGIESELTLSERSFLWLPLSHSEELAMHERFVRHRARGGERAHRVEGLPPVRARPDQSQPRRDRALRAPPAPQRGDRAPVHARGARVVADRDPRLPAPTAIPVVLGRPGGSEARLSLLRAGSHSRSVASCLVVERIDPLRSWPEPVRRCYKVVRAHTDDHRLELDEGRTVGYAIWGDPEGTPVFFTHGTPGSRRDRYLSLDDPGWLRRRRLRFIGVDRPGYGYSDPRPEATLLDCAEDIVLSVLHTVVYGEAQPSPTAGASPKPVPGL